MLQFIVTAHTVTSGREQFASCTGQIQTLKHNSTKVTTSSFDRQISCCYKTRMKVDPEVVTEDRFSTVTLQHLHSKGSQYIPRRNVCSHSVKIMTFSAPFV
jgi:hypothetical protein